MKITLYIVIVYYTNANVSNLHLYMYEDYQYMQHDRLLNLANFTSRFSLIGKI